MINEETSESYKERLKELENRGVSTSCLLSDWCVDCIHSLHIIETEDIYGYPQGICGTGCNGVTPFYLINGKSILAENAKPLKYEKEIETNVEM